MRWLISTLCVSADLDLADDLADLFEAAGHTVGGREREATLSIVVWSHASRRSDAFRAAMKRTVDLGSAMIISREGLVADSGPETPMFDLSGWHGDTNSPLVDALLSAVDQRLMVARFNHGVGSGAVEGDAQTDFAPPRVRVSAGAWRCKAGGAGLRALSLIAVLIVGAAGAAAVLSAREPVQAVSVIDTPGIVGLAEPTALRVAFTDAVSTDASLDDVAPPAQSFGIERGREPPSASSLPERTPAPSASWRDTSHGGEARVMLTPAVYRAELSANGEALPRAPSRAGKPQDKSR